MTYTALTNEYVNKLTAKVRYRYLASLIDYGIYFFFFFYYLLTFGESNSEGEMSVSGIASLPVLLFWLIYFPVIEGMTGQTLGHRIVRLKVISKNGKPINFIDSLKRRILDFIDMQLLGLVAVIIIKNTPTNQRLGDLWSNAIVVGQRFTECRYCHEELELELTDVINKKFECPSCGKIND